MSECGRCVRAIDVSLDELIVRAENQVLDLEIHQHDLLVELHATGIALARAVARRERLDTVAAIRAAFGPEIATLFWREVAA